MCVVYRQLHWPALRDPAGAYIMTYGSQMCQVFAVDRTHLLPELSLFSTANISPPLPSWLCSPSVCLCRCPLVCLCPFTKSTVSLLSPINFYARSVLWCNFSGVHLGWALQKYSLATLYFIMVWKHICHSIPCEG